MEERETSESSTVADSMEALQKSMTLTHEFNADGKGSQKM